MKVFGHMVYGKDFRNMAIVAGVLLVGAAIPISMYLVQNQQTMQQFAENVAADRGMDAGYNKQMNQMGQGYDPYAGGYRAPNPGEYYNQQAQQFQQIPGYNPNNPYGGYNGLIPGSGAPGQYGGTGTGSTGTGTTNASFPPEVVAGCNAAGNTCAFSPDNRTIISCTSGNCVAINPNGTRTPITVPGVSQGSGSGSNSGGGPGTAGGATAGQTGRFHTGSNGISYLALGNTNYQRISEGTQGAGTYRHPITGEVIQVDANGRVISSNFNNQANNNTGTGNTGANAGALPTVNLPPGTNCATQACSFQTRVNGVNTTITCNSGQCWSVGEYGIRQFYHIPGITRNTTGSGNTGTGTGTPGTGTNPDPNGYTIGVPPPRGINSVFDDCIFRTCSYTDYNNNNITCNQKQCTRKLANGSSVPIFIPGISDSIQNPANAGTQSPYTAPSTSNGPSAQEFSYPQNDGMMRMIGFSVNSVPEGTEVIVAPLTPVSPIYQLFNLIKSIFQ